MAMLIWRKLSMAARSIGTCAVFAASTSAIGADHLYVIVPSLDRPTDVSPVSRISDVAVKLQIAPDGALSCTPDANSGHPELRRPSCVLIVERGVFGPNFNKHGVAVPTTIDLVVRWLPDGTDFDLGGALPVSPDNWITKADYPLHEMLGGTTTVAFGISEAGRITACDVVKSSGYLMLDGAVCTLLRQRAIMLPPLDAAGNRKSASGRFSYRWPFGDK